MKPISKAWTEEDVDKLKALVVAGATALRASVVLRRSRLMIRHKARELGIPFRTEAELRAKFRTRLSKSAPEENNNGHQNN